MPVDIKVPHLAESVAEATLMDWQKQPGEPVVQGELLIELETDKVVLEVTAPADGVLSEVLRQPGDTVAADEVLARLDTEAKAAPPAAQEAPAPDTAPEEPVMSPAVRRLVAEHGLDPAAIPASGKHGRLLKEDVEQYLKARPESPPAPASPPPPAPEPSPVRGPTPPPPSPGGPPPGEARRGERRERVSRLRARVAERLVTSQREAAILTTFNEVDMQPVMALRTRYKEHFEKAHGVRLGFMSFFARAAVQGLQRFPKVNAYLEGEEIVYHDYCDIGIAVGSERGLVVPVLRNVEHMGFADIERGINDYAARARDGRLAPEDLAGGTFTITNGGVFGSLLSTPIINPPQTAILGMHKIQDRPMAVDGQVVIRPMMYLALSYDHRLIDGREAVQFLVALKEALEDPARMLLEV